MALEPRSLASAQRLARCYEEKLADIRLSRSGRASHGPNLHAHPLVPTHPQTTFPTTIQNSNTTHSSMAHPNQSHTHTAIIQRLPLVRPSGVLSPFEQRERRAKRLCFNCDEAYSSTHICKKSVMAILECPYPPA